MLKVQYNQGLFFDHFYSHLICKTPLQVPLYSEETLFESSEIKRPQRNLLKFISTISIIQWHEICLHYSYYLEPGVKPWNFLSLILPGTRLITWILPAALTYLIKYFLSFIHHTVSWDLFQEDWTFIVWDKCMIKYEYVMKFVCKMIIIRVPF